LFENWPLILIAIGALILIGAFRRPRASPPAARPEPPEEPVEPTVE
jgi:hypothetical protein